MNAAEECLKKQLERDRSHDPVFRAYMTIDDYKKENAEQKAEIEKLTALVEKLQTCTKCKHFDGENYCKSRKIIVHRVDGYCPNWELAE